MDQCVHFGKPAFIDFIYLLSLVFQINVCQFNSISVVKDPQTNKQSYKQSHKQTHKQTGAIAIHCATKLSAQCKYYLLFTPAGWRSEFHHRNTGTVYEREHESATALYCHSLTAIFRHDAPWKTRLKLSRNAPGIPYRYFRITAGRTKLEISKQESESDDIIISLLKPHVTSGL